MYTVDVSEVSLSAYDDKRYILDDGVSSYTYGTCNYCIQKVTDPIVL